MDDGAAKVAAAGAAEGCRPVHHPHRDGAGVHAVRVAAEAVGSGFAAGDTGVPLVAHREDRDPRVELGGNTDAVFEARGGGA